MKIKNITYVNNKIQWQLGLNMMSIAIIAYCWTSPKTSRGQNYMLLSVSILEYIMFSFVSANSIIFKRLDRNVYVKF